MGLVGLGKVSGSQKTTPLDDLLGLASAVVLSTSLPTARMELCDTPVECDLEIRAEAVGVAVCKTGRPMTSFEGTRGNVEDLGREGFFSSEGEVPPQGRVLVFDNKGIVCDVVGGNVVVIGGNVADVGLLLLTFSCFPAEPSIALGVSANLSSFLVGLSV